MVLECLLPFASPIVCPKCKGNGIHTTVQPNKLSSVITVSRHGFHNGVIAYILQFGESTAHIIFVEWVVFVKAIFSCLNLKPEVFNKTGYDLTDIIIT